MRDRTYVMGMMAGSFLVGVVYWSVIGHGFTKKREAARLMVAEAMGVDTAARRRSAALPDSEAATLYREVFARHDTMAAETDDDILLSRSRLDLSAEMRKPGAAMDDCEAAALARFWARHTDYVDALETAARESDCRFAVDWRDGYDAELSHRWKLHRASRALCSHLLDAAARDDLPAVLRDLAIAAAMRDAARADRATSNHYFAARHADSVVAALAIALNHLTLTDASLAEMQGYVASLYEPAIYDESLIGGAELILISLDDPLWMTNNLCFVDHSIVDETVSPYWNGYQRRMLLGQLPVLLPTRNATPDQRLAAVEATREWRRANTVPFCKAYFTFDHVAKNDATWAVRVNLAVTALAAERYRLAFGEWPRDVAALADFVEPRHRRDWYRDGDLTIRPDHGGVIVYSYGPNGTDDLGRGSDVGPYGYTSAPCDIAFHLAAPRTRPGYSLSGNLRRYSVAR